MAESLRERVLKQLRAEIIAGESPPGMIYSVPSLSAELDISTTPVREALLELANAGLVEPIRNKGFRVSRPSLKELRDLFHMRELIEIEAARLMMEAGRPDTGELRHYAFEIERAVKEDDVRAYLLADRAFHNAMFIASQNELLARTAIGLRDQMRLFGIRSGIGFERQRDSIEEHFRLADLIDSEATSELMSLLRHHIRSWEPIFSDALRQEEGKSRRSHTFGAAK